MWPSVKKRFERQVVRADIVKKMIESGIRVADKDKAYVGDMRSTTLLWPMLSGSTGEWSSRPSNRFERTLS